MLSRPRVLTSATVCFTMLLFVVALVLYSIAHARVRCVCDIVRDFVVRQLVRAGGWGVVRLDATSVCRSRADRTTRPDRSQCVVCACICILVVGGTWEPLVVLSFSGTFRYLCRQREVKSMERVSQFKKHAADGSSKHAAGAGTSEFRHVRPGDIARAQQEAAAQLPAGSSEPLK